MHIPVLTKEIITLLDCKDKKTYLDCTVGEGGHAEAILNITFPSGKLIGLDQDEQALKIAKERLIQFKERTQLIYGNFNNLKEILSLYKIKNIDGILFDLGVSSFQLDTPERGFSFRYNGPLDMRMDLNCKFKAIDLLHNFSFKKLEETIKKYGEERYAKSIAQSIVLKRESGQLQTTADLVSAIRKGIGNKIYNKKIHFATRTFQAIRIAVNDEIENLKKGLLQAIEVLNIKGKICTIAYHSLEDREIKKIFKNTSCLKEIIKKPLRVSEEEIKRNYRSRSSRLRAVIKTGKFYGH